MDGDALRQLIDESGLTQITINKRSGYTTKSIGRALNGGPIGRSVLQAILKVIGHQDAYALLAHPTPPEPNFTEAQRVQNSTANAIVDETDERLRITPHGRATDDVPGAPATRIEPWTIRRLPGSVAQLWVGNDTTYAVSFTRRGHLLFWNLARSRSLKKIAFKHASSEKPLCSVAPNRILVSNAPFADLYSIPDCRRCWTNNLGHSWFWGGHLTAQERHMVLIGDDLVIRLVDVRTGNTLQQTEDIANAVTGLGGICGHVLHCVSDLVPNTLVLTLGLLSSQDQAFVLNWNLSDPDHGWDVSLPGGMINEMKVSPDGNFAACACQDGNTRILDLASGGILATLDGRGIPTVAISWTPHHGVLLLGNEEGIVALWDMRYLQPLAVHEGYPTLSVLSNVSSDGRFAYGTRSGHVEVMVITGVGGDVPANTAGQR